MKAYMTLKLSSCLIYSAGWNSLLEFASAIEAKLKEAGIGHQSLDDNQLDDKIQTLLHGGSVSFSDILPKGLCSMRDGFMNDESQGMLTILAEVVQWMGREKWWLLGLIFFPLACLVRAKYRW